MTNLDGEFDTVDSMSILRPLIFPESVPVTCCFVVVPIPYTECTNIIQAEDRRCQIAQVRGAVPEMIKGLDPLGPFPNRTLVVSFDSIYTVIFNNGYPASQCYGTAYRLCRKISRQTFCITSQPEIRFGKEIRMLAGLQFATFIPQENDNPLKRSISLTQESRRSWKFSEDGQQLEIERNLFRSDAREWFTSTETVAQLMRAMGYPVDDESRYGRHGSVITKQWMAKMPQHSMSLVQRYLRGENVEWSGSGGIG